MGMTFGRKFKIAKLGLKIGFLRIDNISANLREYYIKYINLYGTISEMLQKGQNRNATLTYAPEVAAAYLPEMKMLT